MEQQYLTVWEVSQYLHIKPGTLYAKVEGDEIPHYKVGRLVRFKKSDIDTWMERHRKGVSGTLAAGSQFDDALAGNSLDIDEIVEKVLAEENPMRYASAHGKPDNQIKGHKKGGKHEFS